MITTGESLARSAPFLIDCACLKTKWVKMEAGIALFKRHGLARVCSNESIVRETEHPTQHERHDQR